MPSSPRAVALVTGTSSGIGEAVARVLLRRAWRVIGVSRRSAGFDAPEYTHLRVDLGDLVAVTHGLEATVGPLMDDAGVQRLGLVNNAALVALLGPVDRLDPRALQEVYSVNVAAPVLLMGWLLRRRQGGVPLRIVNVSTGAAVTALPGLGAYGSSKAALRMAGMVLAAELDGRANPGPSITDTTILSYEPGLVDTPMQAAARASSADQLPMVQTFVDWAADGTLVPPEAPATEIADYLESDGHTRWSERRFGSPLS